MDGGGGGTKAGVGGGATEVLVLAGSGPAGREVESTTIAMTLTTNAISTATTPHSHRDDRLRRTDGATTIVVASGSGAAITRVAGRTGGSTRPRTSP